MKIQGLYTAMITPFTSQGELDLDGFKNNIRFQLESGVDGLLPLGTTGETPTLSNEEKEDLINVVVSEVAGQIPVMIGTGSNCTKTTIENTKTAKDLGADIALIVTPFYNKPTQEGIYRHFKAVSEAVDIPIMVYNIAGRTGTNIETNTLVRMKNEIPNIVGVKEASGSIGQAGEVIHAAQNKEDFIVMSGDDAMTLPMMSLGAKGVISVCSNLFPKELKTLTNYALQGDFKKAAEIHFKFLPFFKAAFIESNPIPIKKAMNLKGHAAGHCRLPLCELSKENEEILKNVCKQY